MPGIRPHPHKHPHSHHETTPGSEFSADVNQLAILKSPLVKHTKSEVTVEGVPDLEQEGFGIRDDPHDCPQLQRHEEATIAELFFDLFFAANLSVFSETHDVVNVPTLVSYIGYFSLLWMTWVLVGFYDVRFIADSIFERAIRATHLGVFIGFAVVGPHFSPDGDEPDLGTFRVFSLILMVSRLALTVQYLSMIWHTRKYRGTIAPFAAIAALHFLSAMIYLGVTFAFYGSLHLAYIAWYVVSIFELAVTLGMSFAWPILSFEHTHLLNRMNLLTLIILGEGVIVICKNVSVVVSSSASWTREDIGVLIAAVGAIYLLYQIYFDGLGHIKPSYVGQIIWAFLHFPFHLCLTLFVEGACQFFTVFKIHEIAEGTYDSLTDSISNPPDNVTGTVKDWFVGTVNQTLLDFYDDYPPTLTETYTDGTNVLTQLDSLPVSFYDAIANGTVADNDPNLNVVVGSLQSVLTIIANSLFETFHISTFSEVLDETSLTDWAEIESDAYKETLSRFSTVFAYTFATAGIVLIIMQILFIVSRKHHWTLFNSLRITFLFLLGAGVALLALLLTNFTAEWQFLTSPWILPTLTITFLVTLILVHFRHPPPFFHKKASETLRRKTSY